MEDTVVKQLFFSSRRYGRFSLHSGRCDACAIRLNIAFFHVFWFPTDGIPIRQGAFFGRQIGSPKREHSKTFQNVQREKRTPNLSIPLSLVRRRLEFVDDWSTRVGLSKNYAKFGESFLEIPNYPRDKPIRVVGFFAIEALKLWINYGEKCYRRDPQPTTTLCVLE